MSILYSNDEILKNIMLLYDIGRFDLDCTYSTGVFWRKLPQHRKKADLPFEDTIMDSIMFDPPFVIAGETYKNNDKGSSSFPPVRNKLLYQFHRDRQHSHKVCKVFYAGHILFYGTIK